MSILTRTIRWLYTQSLKLYPEDFRSEFGDEMQADFTQAIVEHVRSGNSKALAFILRELKDLPGSLLYQHWLTIRKEKIPMTTLTDANGIQIEARQPGAWGAAFLAGLPHLLMGLLIGTGKLGIFDIYQVSQTGSAIIGIGLAVLVTGMLIFAWRRGWPLWSASWYLYGTWVSVVIIGLTIERLNLEDSWRYTNAVIIGWILLCIIGYFIILSKSKLHGLLSVAFLFPMLSIMFLEFVPNPIEGWLAISMGLLAAIAAGTIVRIGEFRLALGIVLGLNLTAGLAAAYIGEYKMLDLPSGIPAHIPKISNFLVFLGFYSIIGVGIVAFPFILRGLWNFGRRKLAS